MLLETGKIYQLAEVLPQHANSLNRPTLGLSHVTVIKPWRMSFEGVVFLVLGAALFNAGIFDQTGMTP